MLRHCSTILCAAVAALVAIGLVMLTSTGTWVHGIDAPYHFLYKQSIYVVLGLGVAIGASLCPLESFRRFAPWLFAVGCLLLICCFVPGIKVEIYGSKRWLQMPGLPQFQPSELAKIMVVFCLGSWFARWQTEVRTFWRGFMLPGLIAGVPILLIAGEVDLGTALALAVSVSAIMFCVGTRMLFMIPAAAFVLSAGGWYVAHNENRMERIEAWLNLDNPVYQLDRGMQQWRSLLALGHGGPWGVGLGNGVEKFGTLTFAHIDFIFPELGEELGLPVTLGVVLCYLLIAVAGCGIALQAHNVLNRCCALGLTCVIVVPAMLNIAVATALLPNTGLPLPFISFGGTSMVFALISVGILVGIHRRSHVRVAEEFPLTRQARYAVRM